MITSIEGTLAGSGVDWVDVSVGGVTLRVNVPPSALEGLGRTGDRLRLFTSLQMREDSLALYGFPTDEARSAFEALIGVNGVGPRLALNVLSSLTTESLSLAIAAGDAGVFKRVPGVGAKTAGRIVLELKGKLDLVLPPAPGAIGHEEVVYALTALGYSVSEATAAVSSLPPGDSRSLEDTVRLCLLRMGSR